MAGSSNLERRVSTIKEATVAVTPATPAFTRSAANAFNMKAIPITEDQMGRHGKGQRTDTVDSGFTVTGSLSGGLIYGEFDDLLASLLQGTWTSNVLKNAELTQSFSVEETIPQGAGQATLAYQRYRGVEATSGQLVLEAGKSAALSMDLMGRVSESCATAAITGSTYTAPASTKVIGSGTDIGTITMSGMGTLDCMQSCTINFAFGGRAEQRHITSNDLCGISRGGFVPVITGKFYVEDNFRTIFNAARLGTEFELTIPIGSVTGKKYSIVFFACRFIESTLEDGEDGPALQAFTIHPKYKTSEDAMIKITRAIT